MILQDGNLHFDTSKKALIIAELSANHNQSLELAIKTIHAMKESGADAVKIQTYTADTITIDCDNEYFVIKGDPLWNGETLHSLYQKAFTPWEWHETLQKEAHKLGLLFFSSPFDFTAVDYLEALNVPVYKIASPEITDIPLIRYIAKKQKPMLISTGIATLSDIEEAVNACFEEGNKDIALLHCTTAYPTPLEKVNLSSLSVLKNTFGVETGISDHTFGATIPIASIALGGRIIEKHFILDKSLGGPDAAFSLDQKEFSEMVKATRDIEKAMGKVEFKYPKKDKTMGQGFSARSLFVVKDIKKGELLSSENIRSIRPGYGLHTRHYNEVLNQKAAKDLKKGTPLKWNMLE